MTSLSNHVPDPRLVTAHAEHGDGPLHRVNPWTKVGVVGALVLAVTVAETLPVLAGVYAATLLTYGAAGLPYRRLVGWYALPALFVLSVGAPLALLEPGAPLGAAVVTPLGAVSITAEGAALFAALACRSLAVVTFTLAATMTTRYGDLAHLLGRLLPHPVDQIALLTYRFTFLMMETLEDLLTSVRARRADLGRFWANRRTYARVLGTTLLVAVERSERLVKSMEARGYDGGATRYRDVPRPPAREVAALAACYASVVGYALVAVYGVVPQ
jgi:cobalt/nickel transport system permease protein